ncbi:hypothetical protein JCM11641_002099 [Rhodosporidiobolus odoratus]
MSDLDDLDYDDPRLLAALSEPRPSAELSYNERRKRTVAAQQERGRSNPKTQQQREEEAREEGLSTNLIARDTLAGEDSRGLKMMKAMGFKPGEALGRRAESVDDSSAAATGGAEPGVEAAAPRGGLGFARASLAPIRGSFQPATATSQSQAEDRPQAADKPRTEPIRFEMRTARTGLGLPTAKKPRYLPTSFSSKNPSSDASASTPLPDISSYLAHIKSSVDSRRAFGLLRSARRTLEELDRRAGTEESYMWRDPEEESRDKEKYDRRRLFDKIDDELDDDDDRKIEDREKRAAKKGALAYERGISGQVVDVESEDKAQDEKEEEEEWFAMDVQTRLGLTLAYLRSKYHYCLWCGCQYESGEDLVGNCPGTEEEDH